MLHQGRFTRHLCCLLGVLVSSLADCAQSGGVSETDGSKSAPTDRSIRGTFKLWYIPPALLARAT